MKKNSSNNARLTKGAIGKTLTKLTIPMFFGIVSIFAFNLVDTYFVAMLGTNELAALSFTFPVIMLINNLALGLGIGTSAVVSRAIGEGNGHKVRRLATDSVVLSIILASFIVFFGLLTITPLFQLLGAMPKIAILIKQYMNIWYIGVVFVFVPMVGNNSIRATGDTITPSTIMLLSVIVNIVLDPIMIFGFGPFPKMGIIGAAIATVIARAISLFIGLWFLGVKYKMLTFELPKPRDALNSFRQILYIGLPTAATKTTQPFAMGVITGLIASYGPQAVAAFGVATRIEFFVLAVVMALSSVLGPFVGQNWGAKLVSRMKRGIKLSNRFSNAWGLVVFVLLAIMARPIAMLFNSNPKVISLIVIYLRIVPLAYGLQGVLLLATTSLNVLHKPMHAAAISATQMLFLYIPLSFIASSYFDITGIFVAISFTYMLGGLSSYFVLKNIISKEEGLELVSNQ